MRITDGLRLLGLSLIFNQAEGTGAAFIGPRWPSIFEAPQFHIDIAAKDVSSWVNQAGADINKELSKATSPPLQGLDGAAFIGPRWPSIFEAAQFHMDIAAKDTSNWLKQAGADINQELSKSTSPFLHGLGDCAEYTLDRAAGWTKKANEDLQRDPAGTLLNSAMDVAKVGVFLYPGIVWGPAIKALGFGAGVGQGSLAAIAQSNIGDVVAGSGFSLLQKAGAGGGGLVAGVLNLVVRGGVIAPEVNKALDDIRQGVDEEDK